MEKNRHLLSELWESYPEALANTHQVCNPIPLADIQEQKFALGPYYYYTIQIGDNSLHQIAPKILSIHGLEAYPTYLGQIIDLIHPDDLDFVLQAEKATLEMMKAIGFEHQLNLKNSYCFRMRVAGGNYHLFHHQAVHLNKDDSGKLISAVNIHTDIQNITTVNNKIVLVSGIGERDDYCQIDLSQPTKQLRSPQLSKREMEILSLLAKGLTSKQIGDQLFISITTVNVHRKHLLKKTDTTNTVNLIKRCIEWGLI